MTDELEYHRTAVLVMAHGTPESSEEIEPFYTRIRRGSPPPPELLNDLRRRYEAIGGTSPLAVTTFAQARAINVASGLRLPVVVGTKFATPSIEQAVSTLVDSGIRRVIAMVLSPQYSSTTTEAYFDRVRSAINSAGSDNAAVGSTGGNSILEAVFLKSWNLLPGLISFLASEVDRLVAGSPPQGRHVLFTAHSLPMSVLATGDPYVDEVQATSSAVASAAGLQETEWSVSWQSAGRTGQEWIGPDIRESIAELASANLNKIIVCPVGFSADNLETLYDLDIEACSIAQGLGLDFERARLPNADPTFATSLTQEIVSFAIEQFPK